MALTGQTGGFASPPYDEFALHVRGNLAERFRANKCGVIETVRWSYETSRPARVRGTLVPVKIEAYAAMYPGNAQLRISE